MTARRPLSARRAQEIIDGSRLVKAPDHADSHQWHVVDGDGTVLVHVVPSYGGTSRTGRNGWKYFLAVLGPSGSSERYPNRERAASEGRRAWVRWVTSKETT